MAEYAEETIELKFIGCSDCYWKIQRGLERLDGFAGMDYDPFQVKIDVKYDPRKLSREGIEEAIERMGYRIKGKKYEHESPWKALKGAFSRRRS